MFVGCGDFRLREERADGERAPFFALVLLVFLLLLFVKKNLRPIIDVKATGC